MPVVSQKNVCGLQIAVNDATIVRGSHSTDRLKRQIERFTHRQKGTAHPVAQRFAFEEFGNEVGRSVLHPYIVNREDVRMVQRARGTRLLFEPAQSLGISGE